MRNILARFIAVILLCAGLFSAAPADCRVRFWFDYQRGQCQGFITATWSGTLTVPSDWSSTNEIEVIGGGSGGSGMPSNSGGLGSGGGAGGDYAIKSNVTAASLGGLGVLLIYLSALAAPLVLLEHRKRRCWR